MNYIPKIASLREQREKCGLTRFALSKKIGMGGSALYRIEAGISPSVHGLTAKAIADALGCQVEDIFTIPSRSGQQAATNK